jgi:hypothetical protein
MSVCVCVCVCVCTYIVRASMEAQQFLILISHLLNLFTYDLIYNLAIIG